MVVVNAICTTEDEHTKSLLQLLRMVRTTLVFAFPKLALFWSTSIDGPYESRAKRQPDTGAKYKNNNEQKSKEQGFSLFSMKP